MFWVWFYIIYENLVLIFILIYNIKVKLDNLQKTTYETKIF